MMHSTQNVVTTKLNCLLAGLFFFLCIVGQTAAENSVEDSSVESTAEQEETGAEQENKKKEESFFSFLDLPHESISTGIEYLSSNIDSFFSNEKFYREITSSYVRYRLDSVQREGGDISTSGDLRIRLDLPITRKKLKVIIESDPDELSTEQERLDVGTQEQQADDDYYIGIEHKEKKKRKWKIRPSLGLKVRFPLEPYVRLRALRDYPIDKWMLRVNETLYWFKTFGAGFDSYFDFDRQLDKQALFRASTAARWSDENDYFTLSQFFRLFHRLSERRATSYYIGVIGITQPEIHATDYLMGFQYRQSLHKDWFFLEINPEVVFQKTKNFEDEHKITFRLEMFFGSKYL